MSQSSFSGFPARADVTPLPNVFFTEVMPQIESLTEAKVVMQVLFLLSRRKGYPKFVSLSELSADPMLIRGLRHLDLPLADSLRQGLELAVQDGILLHIAVETHGRLDDLYFVNEQAQRDTLARIAQGTLKIPEMVVRREEGASVQEPSDIYSLYEQNIGMLTPILAEELQDAEHRYPVEWIQEAFREALRANVRNWRYVHSILKRWEREGKKDGKPVRDNRKERDPDRFVRAKHGHVIRR